MALHLTLLADCRFPLSPSPILGLYNLNFLWKCMYSPGPGNWEHLPLYEYSGPLGSGMGISIPPLSTLTIKLTSFIHIAVSSLPMFFLLSQPLAFLECFLLGFLEVLEGMLEEPMLCKCSMQTVSITTSNTSGGLPHSQPTQK